MSRATALVVVAVVALFGVAALLGRAPEQPSGPPSSSYATTPDGLAAYATLLERAGHDVRRVRAPLDERAPTTAETLVIVDGRPLPDAEREALLRHLRQGGRAVLAGGAARLLGPDPRPGTQRVGRGTATLVPDSRPLRNRALASGDNAARGLQLAGPPTRRVAFLESVHGYHEERGLAALPDSLQTSLILLGVAALAFLAWRGRRLGPPEARARALPPPRREHVEALAAALARTRDRDTLTTAPMTTTENRPT